ncbi:MAG TPA: hypothetical protein VLA32_03980, partial [Anaerolineales bacterium]|nr:hypothetical protein [Anaerolineales bacterium]
MAFSKSNPFSKLIFFGIVFILILSPQFPAHAALSLNLKPITWNVIGLDSNDVTDGPEDFPVGVRACNPDPAVTFTDVEADFVWLTGGTQTDDTYIRLRPGSLDPIQPNPQVDLAPDECHDFYFEVELERDSAAYDQTRRYRIDVTYFDPDLGSVQTVSTPTPREIYVERLVSQNRNSVNDVQLADHTADCSTASYTSVPIGGTMVLRSGESYCIKMVGSTATNGYEQIETFTNFPNNIFLINSVDMTYTAHTGSDPDYLTKLYSDACTWNNDPTDVTAPAYRECTSTGKDGGDITVTYDITIIATSGSGALNSLIYDFSGSSYHYNSDFNPPDAVIRNYIILDPNACTQETIASWDGTTTTPTVDNAVGTPTITVGGSVTGPTTTGTEISTASWPESATEVLTEYVQINANTTGYYNISVSYDSLKGQNNGPDFTNFYYWNGSGFSQDGATETNTTTAAGRSHDLTTFTSLDDTAAAAFRLRSWAASGGNAGNRQYNLDNILIEGCKLPAALNLAKTASPTTFTAEGQTITYTYTLINAGDVALEAPYTITDDKVAVGNINCSSATTPLAPGASTTCTGTYTTTAGDVTDGSVTNNATANATSVIGDPVTSNIASRTIYLAALTVVKSSTTTELTAPGTVNYSYLVTNTGNVDLTGISLSDDNDNDDMSCPATTLAVGENMTCTATHTFTQAELDAGGTLDNIVTASSNEAEDATDTLSIPITQSPSMTVEKSSTTTELTAPGTVNYSYLVTNTGNVTLTGISLSDDSDNDDMSCPATTLAVGASMTCTASHTFTQAELDAGGTLDNIVTASSTEAEDATDTLSIPITQSPAHTTLKRETSTGPYALDGTIDYEIVVTNTG